MIRCQRERGDEEASHKWNGAENKVVRNDWDSSSVKEEKKEREEGGACGGCPVDLEGERLSHEVPPSVLARSALTVISVGAIGVTGFSTL